MYLGISNRCYVGQGKIDSDSGKLQVITEHINTMLQNNTLLRRHTPSTDAIWGRIDYDFWYWENNKAYDSNLRLYRYYFI